jgi:hypothetical protein
MLASLNGNRLAVSMPCPDPAFMSASLKTLVWLPEHGMGWLPVTEQPYDAEYFAKYVGYAESELGRQITAARVDLVRRYCSSLETVCDVGIGCGDFLSAIHPFMPAGGCDVNPLGAEWLNLRGMVLDPYCQPVDALTFWDSLEHIPDVHRMLANARRRVFCSLPIVPDNGPPSPSWRHFRRDEHCWYFTHNGFIAWMSAQGFDCEESSSMETLLGRQDIETFVFRRRDAA